MILVTGGAGFIGSHLVDALVAQGHEVTVFDDLSVGRISNIERHLVSGHCRFAQDTVLNTEALEQAIRGVELIYHLAAVVGVRHVVDDPLRGIITNVRGTDNVLDLAFRYGVRTVIASSSEVYGKSTEVPLREESDQLLGPTSVARWSYAHSKALDEYMALGYARKGLPVTAVRYFNAYGPRLDPNGYGSVIARFIDQALRGRPITVLDSGEQTRCFTYVGDTVEGTIRAGTVSEAVGGVFNIGSDAEISVNSLACLIRDLASSNSEIVHGPSDAVYGPDFEETRRRVPDTRRAEQVLGFAAKTDLATGLRLTTEWFRARHEGEETTG